MNKSLQAEFEDVLQKVKNKQVSKNPGMADKLKLYAWYKQALAGDLDIKIDCPEDFVGKMKHQAWSSLKGMSKEEAMRKYIDYFKD